LKNGTPAQISQIGEITSQKGRKPGFLTEMYLDSAAGAKALAELAAVNTQIAEAIHSQRTDSFFTEGLFIKNRFSDVAPATVLTVTAALQEIDRQTDPPGTKTAELLEAAFPARDYLRNQRLLSLVNRLTANNTFEPDNIDAVLALHQRLTDLDWYHGVKVFQNYERSAFLETVLVKVAAGTYPLPPDDRGKREVISAFAGFFNHEQNGSQTAVHFFRKVSDAGIPIETARQNLREIVVGFSQMEIFQPSALKKVIAGLGYTAAETQEISPEGRAIIIDILDKKNAGEFRWYEVRNNLGANRQAHVFPPDIEVPVLTAFLSKKAQFSDGSTQVPDFLWGDFPAEQASDDQIAAITKRITNNIPYSVSHLRNFLNRMGAERAKKVFVGLNKIDPNFVSDIRERIAKRTFENPQAQDLLTYLDSLFPPAPQAP